MFGGSMKQGRRTPQYGGGGGDSTGNYGQPFSRQMPQRQYLPGNQIPLPEGEETAAPSENPFVGDAPVNPFLGQGYPDAGGGGYGPGSQYYDQIMASLRNLRF